MKQRIERLKKERNAVILAHYYCTAEVQQVADCVGDSLALSQYAAATQAEVILFAGVHFMAETAKILCPEKVVLLPDLAAGCSLADSCPADAFALFVAAHPGHTVVSYVNTTAAVKALTDVVCTSSNAVRIVESIPADQPIIFGPDRNLGDYVRQQTGRTNILLWDGACHVHQRFSLERILELKAQNPTAKILAHPECPKPILIVADCVGSTAELLRFSATDCAPCYIVATESGILYQMQQASPDKTFIPAPPDNAACACNDCSFMKLNTLAKIVRALEAMEPRVEVEESVARAARRSIERMLALSK